MSEIPDVVKEHVDKLMNNSSYFNGRRDAFNEIYDFVSWMKGSDIDELKYFISERVNINKDVERHPWGEL